MIEMSLRRVIRSLSIYVPVLSAGCILFIVGFLDLRDFLIFIILAIGILPLVVIVFSREYDPLSPAVLLPFVYTFYAIGPIQVASAFSEDIFIKYIFIQLLGLISMRLGLHAASWRRCTYISAYYILDLLKIRSRIAFKLTIVIIFFLSFLSLATYFASFGGLTGYLDIGYGGRYYLKAQESALIGPGIEWLLLSAILLGFYSLKTRSYPCLFISIMFFLFSSYVVLSTGRRSQILYPLIFGIVLIHYCYRRILHYLLLQVLFLG